jgi:ESCRT-I complex subunit TSG101
LLGLHAAVHAKLSSEVASLGHALSLDAEQQRAHQADLLAGKPTLRDEMARLKASHPRNKSVGTYPKLMHVRAHGS